MHKESARITLTAELYILLLAALLCAAVFILFSIFDMPSFVKWIIWSVLITVILLCALVYAPALGKNISHSLSGSVLRVSCGVLVKYTANVDFRRVVYITKLRGPFERITGVVILAFYFSGGCIYLPVGDRHEAERYIRKWTQRIR